MESPLLFLITLLCFLQSLLVASHNLSKSSTICKTTPDPKYCKTVFPHSQGNVQQYGRFSIRKSLSQSRKFIRTVDKYLKRNAHASPPAVTRALQDCRFLAGLTMDYLLTSFETVNETSTFKTLSFPKADDVQTLLSAALTNEQTCLEGLTTAASSSATWTVRNGVALPLVNDTKLFSVSLALFTKGWVPKKKKRAGFPWAHPRSGTSTHTKPFRLFRNGALPLKMTERTKAVYESLSRRKLADGAGDGDDGSMVLISDIVTVMQDGTGNFTNITAAVAAAPNNTDGSGGFFLIYVTAGIYEEYVSIAKNKRYVMMIGDGINQTVVTGNRSVVDGWTTFNSATFAVTAPNFVAVNITFQNTAGPEKHQAVALRSGADFSIFYSCSFEAYQDTLYTHSLRQFYRECDVYGTVDFIFGNAAVVFQNCNLYPRKPMPNQFNAITAQGRSDPNQNTGTSIQNCTIKPAADLAFSNYTVETYLGRPWKNYSRTVIMESYIDGFVEPVGWREWNGDFALSTLYYAEYNNTGPGSNTTNRVTWPGYHVINSTDAANFTVTGLFLEDDWIWKTGVPYTSGTNLTAYDVVQKYKLPRGILPEGVIDYDLNPKTGFFKVYLNNTCRFPIEVYKVKYQPIVSGFIKNGRVSRLKGVSVKVLYFWLSIGEVTSDGQELELSVGAASEEFSAHQFARSPQLLFAQIERPMSLFPILTASFLFLFCVPFTTAAADGDLPTAYTLLQSYNFPVGILPKGVLSYDLDEPTGKFHAYFDKSCSFALQGSYQLDYKSTISGVISENKLTKLTGVKVKVLFLWLNIVEVIRDGDELEFSVGITSANFAIEEFYESPRCGCGFDCNGLKSKTDNLQMMGLSYKT
ncbi:unnamed protein product [Brassica oleracea]|uniref:pectinesterase n=1 Tax=Brassica napus TaxID=3708 RepID=A0A816KD82_BRANA|nr:unnamed protein product [Brassica napus]